MDVDEEDQSNAKKKKKLTKAAEAKLKAKEKKKHTKDADEEEDAYTKISKSLWSTGAAPKPPVGSFEKCAVCQKQFTVVSLLSHILGSQLTPPSRRSTPWLLVTEMDGFVIHVLNQAVKIHSKSQLHRRSVLQKNVALFPSRKRHSQVLSLYVCRYR